MPCVWLQLCSAVGMDGGDSPEHRSVAGSVRYSCERADVGHEQPCPVPRIGYARLLPFEPGGNRA